MFRKIIEMRKTITLKHCLKFVDDGFLGMKHFMDTASDFPTIPTFHFQHFMDTTSDFPKQRRSEAYVISIKQKSTEEGSVSTF